MTSAVAGDQHHCPKCGASFPTDVMACPRDGTTLETGPDPLVGTELRNAYKITHVLGGGALGRVYHATHLRLPRSVAVKVPRGMWVDHPKSRTRFFNEAFAAGRLAHPNIASVFDFGETDSGIPYLIMEFAPASRSATCSTRVACPCAKRSASRSRSPPAWCTRTTKG